MAVDTSIYGNLLRAPATLQDSVSALDEADLRKTQLAGERLNLIGKQQAQSDDQAVRALYQRPGFDPSTTAGISALSAVSPGAGQAARKTAHGNAETNAKIAHFGAQTKAQEATAAKSQFELARQKLELGTSIVTSATNPAEAHAKFQQAVAQGLMSPEEAAQKAQEVPADPAGFAKWQRDSAFALLTAQQRIEAAQKEAAAAETGRHNRQTESNVVRGQDKVAETAAAGRKQAQAHFDAGMNSPQYMQTDAGLVALPKKLAPGEKPSATVITGPGGEGLGKPLKDIPATANAKIVEGSQAISNIDDAIKTIEAYPGALGLSNMFPGSQTVRQYSDPQGVEARAKVANIGSLVLHDRSGAAVSASEFPRLAPFIPSASDSAETAVKKLQNMKKIAEEELGLYADTYSPSNGYRASPIARKPSADGTPDEIASLVAKHNKPKGK